MCVCEGVSVCVRVKVSQCVRLYIQLIFRDTFVHVVNVHMNFCTGVDCAHELSYVR